MIRILINVLDDEEIWRQLIENELSSEYDVRTFATFKELLENFTPFVDLVIMDVRLKDGTDVIDRIQTIYDISPNCYLIVVSAYFDVPVLQKLIRLRVEDTVTKGATWLDDLKVAVDGLKDRLMSRSAMKGTLL